MKLRGLYAIVDTTSLAAKEIDPLEFARDVLAARPAALQLRAKTDSDARIVQLAREMAALCKDAGVTFVLNDRPDLARDARCEIVHLGQADARERARDLRCGISTHSLDQLRRALTIRPAYVAYGPIFATSSKMNPDPVVGLEGLADARRILEASAAPDTPLVAIGGITLENAAKIAGFADAGAVIAALIADDVTARARELHRALGGSA